MKLKSKYENKIIWITGASSGIGEQIACRLSDLGAKLILSSRNENQLLKVAGKCNSRIPVKILQLDLSDEKSLQGKFREASELFGSIDCLFNIAGVSHRDFALNTNLEIDRRIMQINYFSTIELTKLIIPGMIKQGGGHIVATSSLSGKYGVPLLSAYAASKHALHGFFDSLRGEIKDDRIKITIIIPGFVKTKITENALTGDGMKYGKGLEIHDKGISAYICADKILYAVANDKEEVFIGGREKITIFMNRIFPRTFAGVIRNHPVKKLNSIKTFLKFWKKKN
ncbi:MAG: SDR family oxidoreductase [Ignavibacteria bacterium]|nr:SDR family oxidoreductase [Ignavibacteria bacterium]